MTCLRTVANTTGTAGVPPGADELCDRVADQIMFDVGGKADAGTIVSDLLSATFHALRRNGQIKITHDQFEQEFVDHGYRTFVLRHGHDVIPADANTVLVANSSMVVTHRDQLRSWGPSLVVLDEAAAFKTADAARTRSVYGDTLDGSGGIIDGVRFVLAMSGTLAPAHNGELFPHLRSLAPAALIDNRGRTMRRHVFENTFCVFDARRIAGVRTVQVITGSRNSNLLRQRIDPYVARTTLREIAPTLPPERHEVVPIARDDIKLNELAAIADIEDTEIRTGIETLVAAIREGLVPAPDVDREMTRLMQMVGGGTALAHLRRAYGLAKIPYAEDVVMSRRRGNDKERTPTLIFNTYRMTGDRLQASETGRAHLVQRRHGPCDFSYLLVARPYPKTSPVSLSSLLLKQAA